MSTEGLSDGDKIPSQDVTPATTFFSHSIVTELSEDLMTVKENYLDNIAGLEDIQIKKDGEMITRFELKETADPNDDDVGLVAFSATSLFNILYKNEMDVDYLAALDGFIDKKEVDPEDLESLNIPKEDAEKWAQVVNTSNDTAGDELGTNLNEALSTARIRVTVTDQPGEEGKGIPGAEVDMTYAPSGVVCEDCPAVSDNNGEVILTLTGVDTEAILIEVEASSVDRFRTYNKNDPGGRIRHGGSRDPVFQQAHGARGRHRQRDGDKFSHWNFLRYQWGCCKR